MNQIPITDISKLLLSPGDKVVLRVPCILSLERADMLRNQLEQFFGKEYPVLVLTNGMSLEVVRSEVVK